MAMILRELPGQTPSQVPALTQRAALLVFNRLIESGGGIGPDETTATGLFAQVLVLIPALQFFWGVRDKARQQHF